MAETLTDEQREALRPGLLALMREWSEDQWCAGWLNGLEWYLYQEGGHWETMGRLLGWPIGCDAEDGWESWEQAGERYTAEWVDQMRYGKRGARA